MVRRERLEARGEVAELSRRPVDTEAPTVVLKHVDPGPAIGRVHHHIQCAGRLKHVMQGPQPRIGVGQMVQHAGADYVLEALAELGGALHSELPHARLVSAYLRFSPCVNAMLLALTSIPMTCARGQRSA